MSCFVGQATIQLSKGCWRPFNYTYSVKMSVKGGNLKAELCDAGEELAEEVKAEERGQWQWRLGCMGRLLPGAALEDSADEFKGIANYEGLRS